MFFNWPLRFFMEAYLELNIGSLIKYLSDEHSFATNPDSLDTFLAYFYLFTAPALPFILFITFNLSEQKIKEKKEKGSLYGRLEEAFSEIKLDNAYTINFVTVFLFRRLSLVLVIFFLIENAAVFQAIYNTIFCLFYICYLVHFRPFVDKEKLSLELLTEICFLFFSYTILCYTYFVPEA